MATIESIAIQREAATKRVKTLVAELSDTLGIEPMRVNETFPQGQQQHMLVHNDFLNSVANWLETVAAAVNPNAFGDDDIPAVDLESMSKAELVSLYESLDESNDASGMTKAQLIEAMT